MVKTRGRMVDGILQPGVGIQGAIVQVKDRTAVMSESNGHFSFPLQSNSFSLISVKKQGYQLVDMEACRSYKSTSDPIYLVMETPEQQQADLVAAERKLRRTLQRQLREYEDEIDAMKVSMEEKNRLLAELYKKQENNEKLIAEMAKEYAALDYDQMDAVNQRISDAILNGRLTEADSLLRAKGDIASRVAQIRKEQQAEQIREEEIRREKEALAASREGTMKKMEDLANDCYSFHERFKLANQRDSAIYYIELRAELDTNNVLWQFDAGFYISEHADYSERLAAKKYYLRILDFYSANNVDVSFGYNLYLYSTVKHNLSSLYAQEGNKDKARELLLESVDARKEYAKQSTNPNDEGHVAWALVTLANEEIDSGNLEDGEKHLSEVAEIYQRLLRINPEEHEWATVRMFTEYCALYYATNNYALVAEAYDAAKRIISKYMKDNPEWYAGYLGRIIYFRLSSLRQENQYGRMVEIYNENIAFLRNYMSSETVRSNLFRYECDLASLYMELKKFKECETLFRESLEFYRRLAQQNPSAYDPTLSAAMHNLAIFYIETQRLAESETVFKESLEIDRRLSRQNPSVYEPDVATTLHNLALLYILTRRLSEAEPLLNEALEIRKRLAASNPSDYATSVAETLGKISHNKILLKNYAEAEQYAREGLVADSAQHEIAINLAAALLFQGKYAEAEKICRQYKSELKEKFLEDLDKLAEAGDIPQKYEADVEIIKKMLNEE